MENICKKNMDKYLSKDIRPYYDGKIEWQSFESFWTDFEAQEGIILNVGMGLRHRRALSEAQEGVIWSISRQGHS